MCLHISLTCFMCQCRINNTSKGIYIEKKRKSKQTGRKTEIYPFFSYIDLYLYNFKYLEYLEYIHDIMLGRIVI